MGQRPEPPPEGTPCPTHAAPPRRRRGLRLGVAMVAIAALAAPLARWANRTHRRAEAVAAIRRSGGMVLFEGRWDPERGVIDPEPTAPAWLRRVVGDEAFRDVAWVAFNAPHVDRSALPYLARLDGLRFLSLDGRGSVDDDLAFLEGLTRLESLNLHGNAITDAGLVRLRGLRSLRRLYLGETLVTDAGLDEIGRHRGLVELGFGRARIGDAGLDALRPLQGLRILNLEETAVTDAGLERLLPLQGLASLRLDGTRVTPDGERRFFREFRRRTGTSLYFLSGDSY